MSAGGAGWPCPRSTPGPRRASPLASSNGRQGRPRAESHKLLGTLAARSRSDVDQVRGREAGFFDNEALSPVERAKARSRWQEGSPSHLGQRFLARLKRGEELARFPQPPSQRER